MTPIDIASHINLYVFPTGRRLYALSRVRERALALGLSALADAAERGIDHDRMTQQLELRRQARPTARYPSEARDLDDQVDSAVVGLDTYLSSQTRLFGDHARGRAAAALRQALFPDGTRAIIRLSYVQEHQAIGAVLARLGEPDLAASAAALPELAAMAQHLRQLNDDYGAALEQTDGPAADEVRAARVRGQELLARAFAAILGHAVITGDDDNARALLAPILDQNEAIRSARRRRRPPLDIDPDTGEPLADSDDSDDSDDAAAPLAADG